MTTTDRRALLAAGFSAAAAAALAGCTSDSPGPRQPTAAEIEAVRVARAEAALRLRAVTASRTLLKRYDAALAAHPALAPRLTPLRRSAAAHAKALGEGGTTVAPATAPASPKPTASTAPPAPPVATDPRAALRDLATAARTASAAHTAALPAAPPEYARLLASVAAAGAAHAYLLTEGARA
ncbi:MULTISPECIES: hypothetical protein [unclassified Streptomyces]|uniref:hypothetical protein n=1 Tax=unclassified Streptomyces TaxID=2593676 RepID=UPI0006F52EFC|nr:MULTISPECIES: hypothetical protein [unclassified Streptomyces]KQX47686.1 hypothetical protein ASD33_18220 [Streptomyces sp. Root1304]KRA94959.1 hypothetical protein ASE09_29675 [Streptomyces sp. Root66D1]